jgi:adenosylhomocysteine nucleosidase
VQENATARRPVALLAALELEARGVIRHLVPSTHPSPQLSVWAGVLENAPVILVITGVGKVSGALATQFVCDAFHPRCVLTFGLAGAADETPGRLVIASGALQHDLDARPLTDAKAAIPSLGLTVLPSDAALTEMLSRAAAGVVEDRLRIRTGVVLTGDRIITSREVRDRVLADFPNGACFDMETGAIAQVAIQNALPWAALRVTSDAADETFNLEEVIAFGLNTAAELFERVVRGFLRQPWPSLTLT